MIDVAKTMATVTVLLVSIILLYSGCYEEGIIQFRTFGLLLRGRIVNTTANPQHGGLGAGFCLVPPPMPARVG